MAEVLLPVKSADFSVVAEYCGQVLAVQNNNIHIWWRLEVLPKIRFARERQNSDWRVPEPELPVEVLRIRSRVQKSASGSDPAQRLLHEDPAQTLTFRDL